MTVIAWFPVRPFRTGISFCSAGAIPSNAIPRWTDSFRRSKKYDSGKSNSCPFASWVTVTSTASRRSYTSPVKMYSNVSPIERDEDTIMVPMRRPNVTRRTRDRRRNAFRTAIRARTRCVPARRPIATATPAIAMVGIRMSRTRSPRPHLLDDLTVSHLQDAVRTGRDRGVVRDDDERLAVLPVEPDEEVHDLGGGLAVEVP